MRFYYDTEFLEDGRTIELISIGIVAESGAEYYAVNRDMPAKRIAAHDWLMANVWPGLPRLHGEARIMAGRRNPLALDWQNPTLKRRKVIAAEVRDFIVGQQAGQVPGAELWADYGAYDHVVLCQLWGSMIDLPDGVPMWTHDLRQEIDRAGLNDSVLPEQTGRVHNALADARHARDVGEFLRHAATARP